jgi:hypothetical protein
LSPVSADGEQLGDNLTLVSATRPGFVSLTIWSGG